MDARTMSESEFYDATKMRTWHVQLKFGLYRDYRIVKMADAQGNVREGIFIPFVQNGIRWDGVKEKYPTQYLKPVWQPTDGYRLHKLVPMVSAAFRERMEYEGVLSPDDRYPCDTVGYVCRDRDKV